MKKVNFLKRLIFQINHVAFVVCFDTVLNDLLLVDLGECCDNMPPAYLYYDSSNFILNDAE